MSYSKSYAMLADELEAATHELASMMLVMKRMIIEDDRSFEVPLLEMIESRLAEMDGVMVKTIKDQLASIDKPITHDLKVVKNKSDVLYLLVENLLNSDIRKRDARKAFNLLAKNTVTFNTKENAEDLLNALIKAEK